MELPKEFAIRMKEYLGNDYKDFIKSLENISPTSIRLNPLKKTTQTFSEQVPWCTNGYYIKERPIFTLDPLLHAGAYYVQEAASMFIEQVFTQLIDDTHNKKVLDLCAAPGGKSTLLSSLLKKENLLVANEVIKSRANILKENIIKWGNTNTVVTNNDPKDFKKLKNFFDIVLIDAPCSGEGLFRKDHKAMEEWSIENTELCTQRQKRIISDIWKSIKPGGIIIYSTCTYNKEENEENSKWIAEEMGATPLKLTIPKEWNVTQYENDIYGYQFYPHKTKGEGFYMSVFKKEGEHSEKSNKKNKKDQKLAAGKDEIKLISSLITSPEEYNYIKHNDTIKAFPKHHTDNILKLYSNLYVLYAGCELAEVKNKKYKPLHSLALSTILNTSSVETKDIDLETALKFLRKEDFNIEGPEGWILFTYKDTPIGWGKKLKNRINNYYPKEWRIRMKTK
jgi:NOL1/NOP2/sun family putative RNA methylase